MRVTNLSRLHTKPDLRPLIQFVAEYCDFADLPHCIIADGDCRDPQGCPVFGGVAVKRRDTYEVRISLSAATAYPRTQQLNAHTPHVRFRDWRDEFVTVLAHELRHIAQFALNAYGLDQELEAEVDAEVFAAAVLEAFRRESKAAVAA